MNKKQIANDKKYKWELFEKFKDCDVLGIRTHSDSEVALYINAPSRRFETWLDVEYSVRVVLDVPYGEDEKKALEEVAKYKVASLPKSININGDEWTFGYDNMESGSFYDCIEER